MTLENTGRLLRIASNQMIHQFDRFGVSYGLTSMQMSIIDYLAHSEGTPRIQHDIELEFNVRRSTMTLILQRMEKASLVRRKPAVSDGRQKVVVLTKKSKALATEIEQYMTAQNSRVTETFGEKRVAEFQEILNYYTTLKNEDLTDD